MKCPKCGSNNCQYVAASETHSKGFSSGDACCGLLLMGPAGMLCGLCGTETNTTTKEYWVCHDCGNKFNANIEEIQKVKDEETLKFNEQQKYRDDVEQLTKDYVECFQKLYPENNYEEFLKKKKLRKRVVHIMNSLEVILLIVLFLSLGIVGPLISCAIFVGSVILVNSKRWNRYEQLLPEEMVALIKENEYHMGKLDLSKYRDSINTMRKQIYANEYI